jgi:integrase
MRKTNPLDARRKRKLSDDEIRTLWSVTATMPKYGALVRIILLTAQRRTKIATMKRADIKGDTWTIATEDREKNNAGIIKLPKLALDIINAQPKLNSTDYVFPAGRGLGPFNAFATCFTELKEQMRETLPDMPNFVLHDLRRSARSLMSRAGVRPDIAERCLALASPPSRSMSARTEKRPSSDNFTGLAASCSMLIERPNTRCEEQAIQIGCSRHKHHPRGHQGRPLAGV